MMYPEAVRKLTLSGKLFINMSWGGTSDSLPIFMTLCRQKVTKQGKISGFSTRLIENSAFAIFARFENFASTNWYHKATAPITIVFFTLCPIT